ncbi:MAG: cytochrome P450 [Candidatus Dormibacteraeota bacterium]|nr:cytochrome P450 [Candidatus Dormibacteraeota bacterium]
MSAARRAEDPARGRWGEALDPFPWYGEMRETGAVFQDPRTGLWMCFRYGDVEHVLSDHERFSSRFGDLSLLNTDPPRHRQLRNLVSQAFTPRAVEALRPRVSAIVDELLDAVAGRGAMDLVTDFAVPLPVTVIAELLGIPTSERERFKVWSDAVVTGSASEQERVASHLEMTAFFDGLLRERRREPRDDLVSALLAARIDGEALSDQDLRSFCVLLLVAGNETTTNLIANAVLSFDDHPEAWAELRADPGLVPQAVEEVLRHRSPIQCMFRVARQGAGAGGTPIPPGHRVLAWIGAANRDPDVFEDPDRFDIHRSPNRHVAFGHGIHFCLGAPLARLEAVVALDAFVRRHPDLAVVPGVELEPVASHVVYGVQHLPVRFRPAPAPQV